MTQQVHTKAEFPSLEWFNAIKDIVNNDDGFKRLGTCDSVVGLKVPDREKYYLMVFDAFELAEIKEVSDKEAEEGDFWLEMSFDRWKDLIENIKSHGRADLHHTLNTIDLEDPESLARSHDGYRRDAFYRFNQTYQYFFDASCRIETTFS